MSTPKLAPATLRVLAAGASKNIFGRLAPAFERETGCHIEARFGAAGAMLEQFLMGGADVLILSQTVIADLGRSFHTATASSLGQVKTGVALMKGRAPVELRTVDELRLLLSTATALYFPDPIKSTSGIHFMKVLTALGLADPVKHRTFPDGAVAMAAMAKAGDSMAVGCTQVTEIITTPGVELTSFLPAPYELSTTYAAAASSASQHPEQARALIDHICSPSFADERKKAGFI